MGDFVTPEPFRLTLSGGQYVDIRKRLNHGETEDMYARMSPHALLLDRRQVRTAKLLAYIIGWSLTIDGTPVPMSQDLPEDVRNDTLRNLDPDRALEIYTAIETHEEAMATARAEEKKLQGGKTDAVAISALPSAVAGVSAGSVN